MATQTASESIKANERQPSFFTVEDLAARWKMSTKYVRRQVYSGALQATYFGRRLRVPLQRVLEFERRKAQESAAA